ncbi:hypothetical protein HDU77_001909 [Chytriomyces hyalinus]|nr:hypothetical protein HDU77_001909 [Chytriomyces hyalinus]
MDLDQWIGRIEAAKTNGTDRDIRDVYAEATASISVDRFKTDKRLIGIWLEHLRLEAMASNENSAEIRDKYKYLKSRVGSSSAQMFVQWAQFEVSHGDVDRAKSILNAGIDVKADPIALLEKNLDDLNNGLFKPDTIPSPRIPSKLNRVHSITQDFQTRINPGIPAKESMTPVQKMQALLAGLKKSINQPPSPMEETKTLVHSDLNMSQLTSDPPSKLQNTCDSKPQNSCDSLAAKRPELLSETNETKVTVQDTSVTDISPVAVIPAKQSEETEFLMPVKTGEESPSPPRKINHSKSDTSSVSIPDVGYELSQQSAKSNLLISVNGVPYKRIELIGRGASSKVYKVISESGRIFALKKVKLDRQDPSAIEGYLNEIELLKKLANSKAIISMIDSEICFSKKKHLLLLLEYGEIDLAHLLLKDKSLIGNLNFIRMNWTQMLQAVQQIHNEKIVHSDLKPANFLIVEGALKLIDFGIAKAIPNDTTNVQRDYQTGTLNYMAPEAILFTESNSSKGHLKLGRASDIWSLGCILYQLVYGQPPFSSLPIVQKLNAIVDPNYVIQFKDVGDAALLDVMKSCLNRDPKARMTIPQLLAHPFLNPSVGVSGKVALTKSDILEILMAGQEMRGSGKSAVDLAELYFEQFTERHRSSQRRQKRMRRSQSNSSVPARTSPQILYDPTNGGLPDSHVSPLFLVNMRRNENVKTHSYWPLVALTAVVTQQLAAVVLFVGVFAQLFADSNEHVEATIYPMDGMQPLHTDAHPHYTTPPQPSFLVTHPWHVTAFGMILSSAGAVLVLSRKLNNANETTRDHKTAPSQPHIWRRVGKVSKGGVLLAFILLALTPILRTLTKDTSDDTIWALSSFLFAANLLFCDYSSNSLTTVRYPDSFSINAAVFASVLLASRLNENGHVFSLMCFSIETFALFPILRRSLRVE